LALSIIRTTYQGQATFPLNFALGILSRDHVTVRINDALDGAGNPAYYNDFSWISDTELLINRLVVGDVVEIARTVPKTQMYTSFSAGSNITRPNLDNQAKHALMLYHELVDGRVDLADITDTVSDAVRTSVEANIFTIVASDTAPDYVHLPWRDNSSGVDVYRVFDGTNWVETTFELAVQKWRERLDFPDYSPNFDPTNVYGKSKAHIRILLTGTSIQHIGVGSDGIVELALDDFKLSGLTKDNLENWAWSGAGDTYPIIADTIVEYTTGARIRARTYEEIDALSDAAEAAGDLSSPFNRNGPAALITVPRLQSWEYRVKDAIIAAAARGQCPNTYWDCDGTNSRKSPAGVLEGRKVSIVGITSGATTTIELEAGHAVEVGNRFVCSVPTDGKFSKLAGVVRSVNGNLVTCLYDSTGKDNVTGGTFEVLDVTTTLGMKRFNWAVFSHYVWAYGDVSDPVLMYMSQPARIAASDTTGVNELQQINYCQALAAKFLGGTVCDLEKMLDPDVSELTLQTDDETHFSNIENRLKAAGLLASWLRGDSAGVTDLDQIFKFRDTAGTTDGSMLYYNAQSDEWKAYDELINRVYVRQETFEGSTTLEDRGYTVVNPGATVSGGRLNLTAVPQASTFVPSVGVTDAIFGTSVAFTDRDAFISETGVTETTFLSLNSGASTIVASLAFISSGGRPASVVLRVRDGGTNHKRTVRLPDAASLEYVDYSIEVRQPDTGLSNGSFVVMANGVEIAAYRGGSSFEEIDLVKFGLFNNTASVVNSVRMDNLYYQRANRFIPKVTSLGDPFTATPEDFGARGDDPTFDDGPAIQAAIDYLQEIGGTLKLLPKTYHTAQTLYQTGNCNWYGSASTSDVSASSTLPGDPDGCIKAIAALDKMLVVKAASLGEQIYEVRMQGVGLQGNFLAASGLHASSINSGHFSEMYADRFTEEAWRFDDGNGKISVDCYLSQFRYNATNNAAFADSNGLVLDSDPEIRAGVTNFYVDQVKGITPNGNGLVVGDVDGTGLYRIQSKFEVLGSRRAYTSDGTLIVDTNGDPVRHRGSRKNFVYYYGGDMIVRQGGFINLFGVNSEPTNITNEGGRVTYVSLTDRNNGASYDSLSYLMEDRFQLELALRNKSITNAAIDANYGAIQVPAARFTTTGPQSALWSIQPNVRWDTGRLKGLRLCYIMDGTGDADLVAEVRTTSLGQGFGGSTLYQRVVSSSVPSTGTLAEAYIDLTDLPYTEGDNIVVRLTRNGDTDTGDAILYLFGASLEYEGNGPRSDGGKNFDNSPMKLPDIRTAALPA